MTQKYTPTQIAEMRKLYDIPENFYPVASVSGVVVAWGTKKEKGE